MESLGVSGLFERVARSRGKGVGSHGVRGGPDEGTLGCKFIDQVAVPSTSDGKARARYAVALVHEFINMMVSPCCAIVLSSLP
jgi:hypothetical protein